MGTPTIAEQEHAARQIDKLIDAGAYWQRKWRRDGSKLTHVLLCADLEIVALREQLREHGIEPVDGERTRGGEATPFITRVLPARHVQRRGTHQPRRARATRVGTGSADRHHPHRLTR